MKIYAIIVGDIESAFAQDTMYKSRAEAQVNANILAKRANDSGNNCYEQEGNGSWRNGTDFIYVKEFDLL